MSEPQARIDGPQRADEEAAREQLLDRLQEEALSRAAEGRPLDAAELAARHPELADALDELEEIVRTAEATAVCRGDARPEIAGYELLDELGRGGMGVVYLARQKSLGRLVALKVLPAMAAGSARARARFLQEAEVLARLRHPNVVTIHDVHVEGDLCAYAMECIDGRSLAALAPPADATVFFTRVAAAVARALVALHGAGVLHRDVKPSNILIRPDGTPVLIDFGLVRADDAALQTESGQFVGTPLFAPPEQLVPGAGRSPVDARSDVYGLAATLYHCLARRAPFPGRDVVEVARAQERGPAPPLRRVDPRIPRDLETVVAKALEREPVRRYATAEEFAEDLERVLRLEPVRARPRPLLERGLVLVRRRLRAAALVAVSVAMTLGGGAVWMHRAAIPGRVAEHVRRAQRALVSERTRWYLWRLDPGEAARGGARGWLPTKQLDAAAAELAEALRLAPDHVEARWLAEVVAAARSATPLPSGSASEPRQAGLYHYLVGEFEEALACWRRLDPAAAREPFFDLVVGEALLELEQPAEALLPLTRAAAHWPGEGFLALDLADAAMRVGALDEAGRHLRLALARGGVSRDALLRAHAELALRRGELGFADALLRVAREGVASGVGVVRLQAELDGAAGNVEAAAAGLGRVAHARPGAAEPVRSLERAVVAWLAPRTAGAQVDLFVAAAGFDESDSLAALRLLARSPRRSRGRATASTDFATAGRDRPSPAESPEVVRDLLDSLEIALMSTKKTLRERRLVGLGHWFIASWREPARAGAIARAMVADAVAVARRFAGHAAAAGLGLVLMETHAQAQGEVWRKEGVKALEFQRVTATLPDRDGDGARELIVVASDYDSARGRVEVRSGRTGAVLLTLLGEAPGDVFGYDAADAGDLDGDGVHDLAVGAIFRTEPFSHQGKLYGYSGASGAFLFSVLGSGPAATLGEQVAGIGDVTGDGVPDLAATEAGFESYRGRVLVLSGADRSVIHDLRGEATGDVFGRNRVSNGPDLDGDGRPELLVGAEGWSSADHGRAYLYSGATGSLLHTWDGQNSNDHLGNSAVFGADYDGDGLGDVLIGAYGHDAGGTDSGRIYLFSSRTYAELGTIDGPPAGKGFGYNLSCIGDVDGDGRDEIGAGMQQFDGGAGIGCGQLRVFNGRTLRLICEIDGEQAGGFFGLMLTRPEPLGDVTGDGIPDVAIATSQFDNDFGLNRGLLAVHALAPLGLESDPPNPAVGDTLLLTTLGGVGGALSMDVVVELDGTPLFQPIGGVAPLYGNGERVLAGSVPAGLAGHTAVFRAYAIGHAGRIVASPDERITFQ